MEGSVLLIDINYTSDENDGNLLSAFLKKSADVSSMKPSVSFVWNKPSGWVVRDRWVASTQRRRQLPECDPLPASEPLTWATFSSGEDICIDESGSRDVLVAGGRNGNRSHFISLRSTDKALKALSTYHFAWRPSSVCYSSFDAGMMILVGFYDGCVRMLDAGVQASSDGAESYPKRARSLESCSGEDESDVSELSQVSAVAVMPAAGLIVAGHEDGWFSLWQVESGKFISSFGDERGDDRGVNCLDVCADISLAVSGHRNGVALVWDERRFELKGHSVAVACATIADAKRIVTDDFDGEIRFWNAENGGAALWAIETGLNWWASRSSIGVDGGLFLWASRDGDLV